MSFEKAEMYMEEFGMSGDKPLFYNVVDYVALSLAKRHVNPGATLPDVPYVGEVSRLRLVGPDGLATKRGERLVREVNLPLYEVAKGGTPSYL